MPATSVKPVAPAGGLCHDPDPSRRGEVFGQLAGIGLWSRRMAADLAMLVADKIRSGALPLPPEPPGKCFAGMGTRRPCDGCGELISPDEVEYEVDIVERTLRFHAKCLSVWHEARAERMSE